MLEVDQALREPGRIVNRNLDQQLYLHRLCLPMAEIDLEAEATKEAERQSMPLFDVDDCGEGMCGV